MAKVSFTSITPNKQLEDKVIIINDQNISVKQYISIEDKTKFVETIINSVFDENFIISPIRFNTYFDIELIRFYTNINITDKMMENIVKTYDALKINNVAGKVRAAIPKEEYSDLMHFVMESLHEIQLYNRSFLGIINTINKDQDSTQRNVDTLFQTLNDPDQVGLVKEILDKLG